MIVALFAPLALHAVTLTASEKSFRSNIFNFLKEEGFSPTINDEDNSIEFKKEGALHWIAVRDESPFYVEFCRYGLSTEDADEAKVLYACNEVNKRLKCVKAYNNSGFVNIRIELYTHSAEEFRYSFYKYLSNLEKARTLAIDVYNNDDGPAVSNKPFTINSVDVGITDKDNAVIVSYGSSLYSYQTRYLAPRLNVNVKKAGTYEIYVKMYDASGSLSTGTNSPSGYSYKHSVSMSTGSQTYNISGWGSNTAGHWKAGNYRFEFYYDGELIGQKSFTIY